MQEEFESIEYLLAISVDYHQRRVAFFEWWHKFTTAAGIVLGSGAATVIFTNDAYSVVAAVATLIIALLNASVLAFGINEKARLHSDLRRRYIDLETKLRSAKPSRQHLTLISQLKDAIDVDEPPVKKVVVQLAANAYAYSHNLQETSVPLFQRILAHYVDFELPRPNS